MECYSAGLVRSSEATVQVSDTVAMMKGTDRTEKALRKGRDEKGRKGRQQRIETELDFPVADTETLLSNMTRNIRNHHFLCFVQRRVARVDGGKEIEVLYHGDRTMNTIIPDASKLTLQTDISRISSGAIRALEGKLGELKVNLAKIPMASRYDIYKTLLHHNEFSWLVQVILLSAGTEAQGARMAWRLGDLPVREYGPLCPWCGSAVVARKGRCSFCGKDVPEGMPADQFIAGHLKRQFTDKLVGLRMVYREGDISPASYRERKEEFLALKRAVDGVKWDEGPAA